MATLFENRINFYMVLFLKFDHQLEILCIESLFSSSDLFVLVMFLFCSFHFYCFTSLKINPNGSGH